MQLRTTSTQRTYRYVRLAIVGVVVLIGLSLAAQIATGGALGSVSAAYYTPARNAFVGGLCAASLALLALSGRSVEQALLDLAAVFAPIVAIVPTPIASGDIPGVSVDCPDSGSCVPASAVPDVANGMFAFVAVGVLAVFGAVLLAVVQRTLSPALGLSLAVAGAIVIGMAVWWTIGRETFLLGAHYVATAAFFTLVAAVAAIGAFRPYARGRRRHRALRIGYGAIAAGIVVSLVFVVVLVLLRASGIDPITTTGAPLFFVGEAVALVLFAAFWAVQTAELWDERDPAYVRA